MRHVAAHGLHHRPDLGLVLHPARPNPFNPATTVRFELARAGQTTLRVYDVAGRLVTTLIDEERAAGSAAARWDGRDARGRPAPSGVYLVELRQDDQRAARKLLLAK